jgi:hypothetical protein
MKKALIIVTSLIAATASVPGIRKRAPAVKDWIAHEWRAAREGWRLYQQARAQEGDEDA